MNKLVRKLEDEAGLTHEQARMSVGIFRDYLIEKENDPDLIEAIKLKAAQTAKTAKVKYENLTGQAEIVVDKVGSSLQNTANQVGDKADDILHQSKSKIREFIDKVSDYLEEDASND